MAININGLTSNGQIKQNTEHQTQVKQQVTQNSASAEHSKLVRQDSVSITPQAKQLSELQKKAIDAPVVDKKKIDQLKSAIISGQYKIDPEKLAASIAGFEFELN